MNHQKTTVLDLGTPEEKRSEIKAYFNATFDIYEELFTSLKNDDAYYVRAEPLRHPLIFYFGHTATFYINKLVVSKLYDQRVNEGIESIMAIGVDEMSWDDLDKTDYQWPSINEVQTYRDHVRDIVNHLIDTMPLRVPVQWDDPFWVIMMGIEHERIHLETSSVLIRQTNIDWVQPIPGWPICEDRDLAPDNKLLEVQAGTVLQGRTHPSHTYGWDNEFGQQKNEIKTFKASKFLVSNREFLDFVQDEGYENKKWWSLEGWSWKEFRSAKHPPFWIEDEEEMCGYRYRTMCEEIAMPLNWPVDVNFLEAKAFCNWLSEKKGKRLRLPSEPEWYRLYESVELESHSAWLSAPGNINLEHFASSCPVDMFMTNDFGDVIGNVWQWTESAIDGLEGFRVHPAYDDFSVPTFDGKHNLIKGGSWISTGNSALAESRYAFRRHFFQHAGFRYVESDRDVVQDFNVYESDELIAQYLEFHYGDNYFGVPNFPKACIDIISKYLNDSRARAFDLGCAVGRSSFELARYFDHVDALDFSTRFIQNAIHLQEKGKVSYMIPVEGEIKELKTFELNSLDLDGGKGSAESAQRVDFTQGDASNLRAKYTDYDLVFAGNLIDRLYDPKKFLEDIQGRIRQGGLLVITSPYTWLEEYTERSNWLGGKKVNGENVSTLDGIAAVLCDSFDSVTEPIDVPFVIRETARKHQHTIAQLSIWRKK